MNRNQMVKSLFPDGIPRLWCPVLTHYKQNLDIDFNRLYKHIEYIKPDCFAYLIPGSTGDGWELSENETDMLLDSTLKNAKDKGYCLLIGALEKNADETLKVIRKRIEMIKEISGFDDVIKGMEKTGVKGFVVCPPAGEKNQKEILRQLEEILDCGYPICLYQLPQVTNSEMTPETVAELYMKYQNLYMVKDSSGEDKLAHSGEMYEDLFLVRGAEGGYAEHISDMGGDYNGFLLSTVNSFPKALGEFVKACEYGDAKKAKELSETVSSAIAEGFEIVSEITMGNMFANSNKCFDFWNAFGAGADSSDGPMIHAGAKLPKEVIEKARKTMKKYDVFNEYGYMSK